MPVLDAPTMPVQRSETLRGSIARVSHFPSVGEYTDKRPSTSAWKGDWDKWDNWDQWDQTPKK